MKNFIKIISISALLASSGYSYAGSTGFGVSAHGGLTGTGLTGLYAIDKNFTVRAGFNSSDIASDFNVDGVDYNASFNLDSKFALIDWHPFKKFGGRVTAGIYSNSNTFSGIATSDASNFDPAILFGTATITVATTVSFASSAPYVGVGWSNDNNGKTGLIFGVDVGLMIQGTPDVTVEEQVSGVPTAGLDLTAETQAIKDELSTFEVYPVIMASVGFQF